MREILGAIVESERRKRGRVEKRVRVGREGDGRAESR